MPKKKIKKPKKDKKIKTPKDKKIKTPKNKKTVTAPLKLVNKNTYTPEEKVEIKINAIKNLKIFFYAGLPQSHNCFEKLKAEKRKALVVFITAGDPDLEQTKSILDVIDDSGADIIELGVPFSDPLADGSIIQAASLRSLKSGTTLKKIISLVKEIRRTRNLPIILMTSFNPVFVYGEQQFVKDAVSVGVDGVIIPDLPPEEADKFSVCAEESGLDLIHLLAPTSPNERIEMVAKKGRGFIYYISLTGTTGVRAKLADDLGDKVASIKQISDIPVLIGFGISSPDLAREATKFSDGVIVGSAVVKLIESNSEPIERNKKLAEFITSIKQAISNPC